MCKKYAYAEITCNDYGFQNWEVRYDYHIEFVVYIQFFS